MRGCFDVKAHAVLLCFALLYRSGLLLCRNVLIFPPQESDAQLVPYRSADILVTPIFKSNKTVFAIRV